MSLLRKALIVRLGLSGAKSLPKLLEDFVRYGVFGVDSVLRSQPSESTNNFCIFRAQFQYPKTLPLEMLKSKYSKNKIEAGCDEAGRGCLAGPVFAAAVILPRRFSMKGLDDSKKIKLADRLKLRKKIEKRALAWAVGSLDNHEIDEVNILNASHLAMHRALDQLTIRPELILVDGNRFRPYHDIDFECIIQGDGKFASIAAASILAKTYRDEYMQEMHLKYPGYDWCNNKGYPTKRHRAGIRLNGPTVLHRRTFRLLPEAEQIEIDFQAANKAI